MIKIDQMSFFPSTSQSPSLIDEEIEKQHQKMQDNQNYFSKTITNIHNQHKQKLLLNGSAFYMIEAKLRRIHELEERVNELTKTKAKPTPEEIQEALYRYHRKELALGDCSSKEYQDQLIQLDERITNEERTISILKSRIQELSGENKALKLALKEKLQK